MWKETADPNDPFRSRLGDADRNPGFGFSALVLLVLFLAAALFSCSPSTSSHAPPILLFNGTGTSVNDVAAVEGILKSRNLSYATADSAQINGMSESQFLRYRLLIIPGGHYLNMGNSLTPGATANIRRAVEGGLNYLGICAGGLLAGDAPCPSLNLTSGVRFGFYAVVNRGIHKAPVAITTVGAPALEHYWEDGPQFTGWGKVVGTYPDGTPAIVQSAFGQGWVVLCGVHPEAPEHWRHGMTFTTPASVNHTYGATLIEAALHRTPLPNF